MNWQETTKELKGEGVVAMDMARELLKLQAQASFKAGYEEGRKGCPAPAVQGQIYLEGYDVGIREAVSWIRQYHGLDFEEAKAKLKEWGIAEGQ